ncbi:MAG: invasion associated locus B family protein [Rickettsiales bacterium]|nr:invasion associated locus B family protein [Rickettsiales bacterium]
MRNIFILLVALFLANSANSQEFIGEFKYWGVFKTNQDGKNVCYATSVPYNKTGNYRKRGEPYVLVTLRGNNQAEVSVNSGFPYKENSEVEISIDRKHNFRFFTSAQTPQMAWAKDNSTDNQIVQRMKNGNNLTTKGTSKIGTYATDTYRLAGFTAAVNKMKEVCK